MSVPDKNESRQVVDEREKLIPAQASRKPAERSAGGPPPLPSDPVTVPNFATMTLTTANNTALGLTLVLSYCNRAGEPIAAPPSGQWGDWTVVKNMPPPAVGSMVSPGTQVTVMIVYN